MLSNNFSERIAAKQPIQRFDRKRKNITEWKSIKFKRQTQPTISPSGIKEALRFHTKLLFYFAFECDVFALYLCVYVCFSVYMCCVCICVLCVFQCVYVLCLYMCIVCILSALVYCVCVVLFACYMWVGVWRRLCWFVVGRLSFHILKSEFPIPLVSLFKLYQMAEQGSILPT